MDHLHQHPDSLAGSDLRVRNVRYDHTTLFRALAVVRLRDTRFNDSVACFQQSVVQSPQKFSHHITPHVDAADIALSVASHVQHMADIRAWNPRPGNNRSLVKDQGRHRVKHIKTPERNLRFFRVQFFYLKNLSEEVLRSLCLGRGEHLIGCSFFLDDSVRDEDDAVGNVARKFHFVCNYYHSHARFR